MLDKKKNDDGDQVEWNSEEVNYGRPEIKLSLQTRTSLFPASSQSHKNNLNSSQWR